MFTAVCEPVCVRGEGHDKGLHLVIIAGCVISGTRRRTSSEKGCACGVRGEEGGWSLKDPLTTNHGGTVD